MYPLVSILAFIWEGKRISKVKRCLGRVVDILEASGAFDPGSNPGRGVFVFFILHLPGDLSGIFSLSVPNLPLS
jgi:hypothetical protein